MGRHGCGEMHGPYHVDMQKEGRLLGGVNGFFTVNYMLSFCTVCTVCSEMGIGGQLQ